MVTALYNVDMAIDESQFGNKPNQFAGQPLLKIPSKYGEFVFRPSGKKPGRKKGTKNTNYLEKTPHEVHQEKLAKLREKKKIWREEHKEEYLAQNKEERQRRLKLRFQVFARDKFTCQYCGRKAPDVVIQIDHVKPKSKGGANVEDNYVTACEDCNVGKCDYILQNI